MVARSRQVEFDGDDNPVDMDTGYRIIAEVAAWLGFENSHAYLAALHEERERIFERARD